LASKRRAGISGRLPCDGESFQAQWAGRWGTPPRFNPRENHPCIWISLPRLPPCRGCASVNCAPGLPSCSASRRRRTTRPTVTAKFPEELKQLRCWDGTELGADLRQRLLREFTRWLLGGQRPNPASAGGREIHRQSLLLVGLHSLSRDFGWLLPAGSVVPAVRTLERATRLRPDSGFGCDKHERSVCQSRHGWTLAQIDVCARGNS